MTRAGSEALARPSTVVGLATHLLPSSTGIGVDEAVGSGDTEVAASDGHTEHGGCDERRSNQTGDATDGRSHEGSSRGDVKQGTHDSKASAGLVNGMGEIRPPG